jgi:hypothetical protein
MHPKRPFLSSSEIRRFREAADTLTALADAERQALIEAKGILSYIQAQLGTAVHHPARGCELIWPEGRERVGETHLSLGEYLSSLEPGQLPRAVVINGKRLGL